MLPDRKCRVILYSSAPAAYVDDDDDELVRYWGAFSTIVSQTRSAHSLLAAAVLVDELVARKFAFVRVDGRNLRVPLAPPYARYSYEPPDDDDAKPHEELEADRRREPDSRL